MLFNLLQQLFKMLARRTLMQDARMRGGGMGGGRELHDGGAAPTGTAAVRGGETEPRRCCTESGGTYATGIPVLTLLHTVNTVLINKDSSLELHSF